MQSRVETAPAHEPGKNSSRKRTVWLVDDDKELRTLFAEVLPQHGPLEIVRTFGSVPELLEGLKSGPRPEVLVLDIQIGSDNGVDAIEPVRQLAPTLPVVML